MLAGLTALRTRFVVAALERVDSVGAVALVVEGVGESLQIEDSSKWWKRGAFVSVWKLVSRAPYH
jgi:hypothetical protein